MNLVIDKTLVASSNLVLQIIADHHFIKNKKKFYIKDLEYKYRSRQ